jgi:MYXO-CTERM domain-containing protein
MLKMASLPRASALALALSLGASACAPPSDEPEPVGSAAEALGLSGLFTTGVNNQSMAIASTATDPHYVLSSNDPAFPGPAAIAVNPAAGWIPNTGGSKWISVQGSAAGGTNLVYTYTTTFTLAAVDPATASITGKWACDDACVMTLNGTQVAADPTPAWSAVANFSIPAGGPFVLGTNTLAVAVTNITGGPTGVQITQITGTTTACTLDSQCPATDFCNTVSNNCVPKLANGTPIPIIANHTPPLVNICNAGTGAAVCTSGVCDVADNDCGLANGHGTCTLATGPTVCRSGQCSAGGVCIAAGTCSADADCAGGKWCNESTHVCTAKFANGSLLPTDPAHGVPVLNGMCNALAATLVCVSGVCDGDNRCGLADGSGMCSAATGPVVCRSGMCSTNATCEPAGGCNVDADCTAPLWCDESTHTCTPQVANGGALPIDGPHMNPTLDGTCNAGAGLLVCVSGVCDTDELCGLAYGHPGCTVATGPTVCRLGVCSPTAMVCIPGGGCAADADCAATDYCDTPSFMCVPKVANGQPIPTVAGHSPILVGLCSTPAALSACASGVCDQADNECGYVDGEGPCTAGNGDVVCRSGQCSADLTCLGLGACNADGDCTAAQFCDTSNHACAPKVPNGGPVPTIGGHTPALDGMCSTAEAMSACLSGVCDTTDDDCGYANGHGPCTDADGATVCRSAICSTTGPTAGTCVGCVMDAQCPTATPVCDTGTATCVQCTSTSSAACVGATPVCDVATSTCAPCDGDFGSGSKDPCATSDTPLCFTSGANQGRCGKCSTNADCASHPGTTCDAGSGTCVTGCQVDADCSSSQWCDVVSGAGTCTPKLDNGKPLPTTPASVATCTDAVGARVCVSGVCDPKDDTCGLLPTDGPCTADAMCRQGTCDLTTMTCSSKGCTKDADCPSGDFCKSDGTCTPKLPNGKPCDAPSQCISATCEDKLCSALSPSGNGLLCAATPAGGDAGDGAFGLVGLMLAAAGLARRRRRVPGGFAVGGRPLIQAGSSPLHRS